MHDRMVDLQRYTATSGERDFVERIKAPIFLVAVSAIYIYIDIYIYIYIYITQAPFQLRRESQQQYLKLEVPKHSIPLSFLATINP